MHSLKLTNLLFLLFAIFLISGCSNQDFADENPDKALITDLVEKHAEAWKTGNVQLLYDLLHDDVIFAYPGRRLNKAQTIEDLIFFNKSFKDTEVYINEIIIDGNNIAVEWQFATTSIEGGERQVVSDGIIGKVKDGKIILWKEYLDGRVKKLQASGELELDEGEEPFPWPRKINPK